MEETLKSSYGTREISRNQSSDPQVLLRNSRNFAKFGEVRRIRRKMPDPLGKFENSFSRMLLKNQHHLEERYFCLRISHTAAAQNRRFCREDQHDDATASFLGCVQRRRLDAPLHICCPFQSTKKCACHGEPLTNRVNFRVMFDYGTLASVDIDFGV